jgi:putative transposase
MMAFIDDQREAHGIEPICKVLPIAPSTYHATRGVEAFDPRSQVRSQNIKLARPCQSAA